MEAKHALQGLRTKVFTLNAEIETHSHYLGLPTKVSKLKELNRNF